MIELKSTAGNVRLTTPTIIAGGGGSIDLSNYYTKAEVDAKIPDVSGFITESEADTKINTAVCSAEERVDFKLGSYALKTEIPDVSGLALKSEIPDVSGFQTEEQVNSLINSALGVIENGTY